MKSIQEVIQYANENKISKPFMTALHKACQEGKKVEALGDDPNRVTSIIVGDETIKVVYTIEEQPIGWCHHLSMSLDRLGNRLVLPSTSAVNAILGFLEMKSLDESAHVYVEESVPLSINVISLQ